MKQIKESWTYHPGKCIVGGINIAFRDEDTKSWIVQDDVEAIIRAALSHVLSTLQDGDKLSITIAVQGKSEE